jgi:hypothetical protein
MEWIEIGVCWLVGRAVAVSIIMPVDCGDGGYVPSASVTLKIQVCRANMDLRQSNATPELQSIQVTPRINTQAVSRVNTLPISNKCHIMLRYFAAI